MKKKILVDVKVEIELSVRHYNWQTMEQYARSLESAVEDFQEFLRDHRSQDVNQMSVERIYEDQCSFCESKWEEEANGLPICCTKAQEEWCAKNNMFYDETTDSYIKVSQPEVSNGSL